MKKAKPPKGGDAKPRIYSIVARIAGLPIKFERLWIGILRGVFFYLNQNFIRMSDMAQHLLYRLNSTIRIVFWIDMVMITLNIQRWAKRSIAAAILTVFCFPAVVFAADYTLTWAANTEPELEGYKIYYKTDSQDLHYEGIHPSLPNLDSPIDVGNVTEYTIHNLDENIVYSFVVTAYDSEGFESGYSNEVSTEYLNDSADQIRSVGSDDGGEEGTGCFIQITQGRHING